MTPSQDRGILSADTTREMEARQIHIWRGMSTVELAALIDDASQTARRLALAGLRADYPGASDRELFLRLVIVTLGHALALQAYPEIAQLQL